MNAPWPFSGARRILLIGCHADDIEIGVGGTLARLLESGYSGRIDWAVLSADEARREEALASAEAILGSRASVHVAGFRDGHFPVQYGELKAHFADLRRLEPDLLVTHRREDMHQDHRTVAEITWTTFRRHTILEYEIPKYEGDLGHPNLFVELEARHLESKVRHLREHFASQQQKQWYDPALFEGLARLRGSECAAPSGFAEGLYARKLRV